MLPKVLYIVFVIGAATFTAAKSLVDGQLGRSDGIIGGQEVDIKQFPHHVAVVYSNQPYCGGSIISERYVMTAAHCLWIAGKDDLQVRAGTTYNYKGGKLYDIENFIMHEKFGTTHSLVLLYDIAIIKIDGKMEINGVTTKAVKLPEPGSDVSPGTMMTFTGWGGNLMGESYGDFMSIILKAVNLPVVDRQHCTKAYNSTVSDIQICAGYEKPGQSPCLGDGGGPLISDDGVQYGILSFRSGDCTKPGPPNGFTNVSAMREWIRDRTGV